MSHFMNKPVSPFSKSSGDCLSAPLISTISLYLALTVSPSTPRISLNVSYETSLSLHELCGIATGIPLSKLKLIFAGKLIPPHNSCPSIGREMGDMKKFLEEHNLFDNCVIHCMGKPEKLSADAALANDSIVFDSKTIESLATSPSSASFSASTSSSSTHRSIEPILQDLKAESSSPKTYLEAIKTLYTIINNVLSNPREEKYRTLNSDDVAFQSRLGGITGSEDVLQVVGFESNTCQGGKHVVWTLVPSEDAWSNLMKCRKVIKGEVKIAKQDSVWSLPEMGDILGTELPEFDTPEIELMMNRMVLDPPNATAYVAASPEYQQMKTIAPTEQCADMDLLARNPLMMQQMIPMMQELKDKQDQLMCVMDQPILKGQRVRKGCGSNNDSISSALKKRKSAGERSSNKSEMTEEELIAEAISRSLVE